MDKAGESLTGAGDRIAGAVQPGLFPPLFICTFHLVHPNCFVEGEKGAGQKLGDATRSGSDNASKEGGGIMDSISDTVSGMTGSKK